MNTNFINIIKEENSLINTCFLIKLNDYNENQKITSMLTILSSPQPDAPKLVVQDERIELRRRTHSKRIKYNSTEYCYIYRQTKLLMYFS